MEPPAAEARLRREAWCLVELAAFSGLAVTQPALDLLARNVGIFAAHASTPLEITAVAVAALVLPALAAYCVERLLATLRPTARPALHASLVAVLAALFCVQLTWHAGGGGAVVALVAVGTAVAGYRLVRRVPGTRTYLRVLAVGPVVISVMFLVTPPISGLVLPGGAVGVAGASVERPKRVVVIVADELPLMSLMDGHGAVDAGLYPNLARLAAGANWYRNTTTVHGFTAWAVPALLTGRLPSAPSQLPDASDYPHSLFTLLGGAYRMNVHESAERVCPSTVCVVEDRRRGFGRDVAGLLGIGYDLWRDSLGSDVAPESPLGLPSTSIDRRRAMDDFVASLQPSDRPVLDYLHVLMPHEPWQYLPTGQDVGAPQSDPANELANGPGWGSAWAARISRTRHILQLQALDRFVGRVTARLHRIGAWDDSLVVFTADHGAAFTSGEPVRWVRDANAPEILFTPLFMKLPGQHQGRVDDRPVESIDVLPTIADVLGVHLPWPVDGVSVLHARRAEFGRRFAQWRLRSPATAPDVPTVAPGKFLRFDARELLPRVLAATAAPPGRDARDRPYEIGPFGGLIGTEVAAVPGGADPPIGTVEIDDRRRFASVDLHADRAPWALVQGHVSGIEGDRPLAVAVNGRIAGLSAIDAAGNGSPGAFVAALSPAAFRPGSNDVRVFVIAGKATAPTLVPIAGPST